jgi:hypothetical protein
LQPGRVLARHDHGGGRRGEAVAGVVGGVADQEHEPPALDLGLGEAGARQRPPDPLPLPVGVDRQRAQQQRRPMRAQPDRPVADGADQLAGLPGDEAQLGQRRDAVAVAVGGLAATVGAERPVQEGLDRRPVVGAFGEDREHGRVVHGLAGDPMVVTRAVPTLGGGRRTATGDAREGVPASSSVDGQGGRFVLVQQRHGRRA